ASVKVRLKNARLPGHGGLIVGSISVGPEGSPAIVRARGVFAHHQGVRSAIGYSGQLFRAHAITNCRAMQYAAPFKREAAAAIGIVEPGQACTSARNSAIGAGHIL